MTKQELEKILNGLSGKRCLITRLEKGDIPEMEILALQDVRACKPLGLLKHPENEISLIQLIETFKIHSTEIEFLKPNQVALCLSVATRSMKKAKTIYGRVIKKTHSSGNWTFVSKIEHKDIYDYFEHIQEMIVFTYTAIEAFANIAIPNDFTYERFNNRRIKEIMNKENIERWVPTSEKIEKIIPLLLHVPPPPTEIMKNFKELELIRNDLIHPKTTSDLTLFKKLLHKEIFTFGFSGIEIIDYFCGCDPQNSIYPLGFEESKINIIKISKYEDVLKDIREEEQ